MHMGHARNTVTTILVSDTGYINKAEIKYSRNAPQQTKCRISQLEFFHPSLRDVIHHHSRIIISTPLLTLYSDHPLYNDDGVAFDIIITRRVRLLQIMDIPTITKRRDRPLPAAQMRDADSRMCKRMYRCKIERTRSVAREEYKHVADGPKKGDCTKGGKDGLDGMRTFASRLKTA